MNNLNLTEEVKKNKEKTIFEMIESSSREWKRDYAMMAAGIMSQQLLVYLHDLWQSDLTKDIHDAIKSIKNFIHFQPS